MRACVRVLHACVCMCVCYCMCVCGGGGDHVGQCLNSCDETDDPGPWQLFTSHIYDSWQKLTLYDFWQAWINMTWQAWINDFWVYSCTHGAA